MRWRNAGVKMAPVWLPARKKIRTDANFCVGVKKNLAAASRHSGTDFLVSSDSDIRARNQTAQTLGIGIGTDAPKTTTSSSWAAESERLFHSKQRRKLSKPTFHHFSGGCAFSRNRFFQKIGGKLKLKNKFNLSWQKTSLVSACFTLRLCTYYRIDYFLWNCFCPL